MNSRSSKEVASTFVLVICEECRVMFAELATVFHGRHGDHDRPLLCIECDPEAEKEQISLTAKGFEEAKD